MRIRIFHLLKPCQRLGGAGFGRLHDLSLLCGDLCAQRVALLVRQLARLARLRGQLIQTALQFRSGLRVGLCCRFLLLIISLYRFQFILCIRQRLPRSARLYPTIIRKLFLTLQGGLCLVALLHQRLYIAAGHAGEVMLLGQLLALLLGHAEQRQQLRIAQIAEKIARRLAGKPDLRIPELTRNAHIVLRRAGLVAELRLQIMQPLALWDELLCLLQPPPDLDDALHHHPRHIVADGADLCGHDLDRPHCHHITIRFHLRRSPSFFPFARL